MKIEFCKQAIKFIDRLDETSKTKILEKLRILKEELDKNGFLPIKTLDIKKLKGEWVPLKRLRVGNIRIIFDVDIAESKIKIYTIDNRGNIY